MKARDAKLLRWVVRNQLKLSWALTCASNHYWGLADSIAPGPQFALTNQEKLDIADSRRAARKFKQMADTFFKLLYPRPSAVNGRRRLSA